MSARGDVELDTENVFHEFHYTETELVSRALSALEWWFTGESKSQIRYIESYGKGADPGVIAFDTAVRSAPDKYFVLDGPGERRVYETILRPQFNANRALTPAFLVPVGNAQHAAERRLILEYKESMRLGDAADCILLGSGDHETSEFGDELMSRNSGVAVWVVMAPGARDSIRRYGALGEGNYPHIPRNHVAFFNDILNEYLNWLRDLPARFLRADAQEHTNARDAINAMHAAPPMVEAKLDDRFWAIADIDWEALHEAVPGSEDWNAALRDEPWLMDTVATNLRVAAGKGWRQVETGQAGFVGCRLAVTIAALTPILEPLDAAGRRRLQAVIWREPQLKFVRDAFGNWPQRFGR